MHVEPSSPATPASGDSVGRMQAAKPAASAPASAVSREFHNFLADLEELISATTAHTGEDLTRLRQQLGERVTAAKHSAEELGSSIDHQARRTASATNDYVHQQPWNAIGIAGGVGFLLGFLLARRD